MAYDSSISSFTTKTDKVDVVSASHINTVQSELVTIETILGTNVKGVASDLKTRLSRMMDTDGSVLSGTSFPCPSFPTQMFYRTDLESFYVMNSINSAWNVFGNSTSNVLFSYSGQANNSATTAGFYTGTNLNIATGTFNYAYWVVQNTTYKTAIQTKWNKIAGVSTITVYALIWSDGSTGFVLVDVGGQQGSSSTTSTTPAWVTFTIDVSGLTNGTVYDVVIQIKNGSTNYNYLGSIIAFGS